MSKDAAAYVDRHIGFTLGACTWAQVERLVNLVPLCRRHHRAKTHSEWRYVVIDPGTYLWTSPNHRRFLVDHRGTRALDPSARLDPPTMDVEHDYETNSPQPQNVPPCPGGDPPDQ